MATSLKNPYLKKANTQHEYAPNHIQELDKCAKSAKYFIRNYCQIQHPVRGSIPFELYNYQDKMLDTYQEHRQVIVLSARQTGKCLTLTTNLPIVPSILSITIIKKIILWIINRKVYNEIINKSGV